LRKNLEEYLKITNLQYDSFLFPSKKGNHIGRVQAYRILKEAAVIVGIENFGTHSLRKT
jgi:integrase